MPSESGVTSRSSMVFTPRSRMLAWTAAPSATTSSGFNSVCGFRSKNSWTMRRTSGVRVVPPTRTTSSTSAGLSWASARACLRGPIVRSTMGRISASNSPRVNASVRQGEPKRGGFGFRQLMLQADQGFAEFLRELAMGRKVDFMLLQDKFVYKSLQKIVDIVAAEVRVAVGRKYLIDVAVARGNEFQDGNIKRAAAEIVDGHATTLFFMQAVGERRGGRLIDEPENLEAGDFAGIFCGLALRVVEIGRHGDDRTIHGFTEERFRPVSQFAQNECRNFRWSEDLVAQYHANY